LFVCLFVCLFVVCLFVCLFVCFVWLFVHCLFVLFVVVVVLNAPFGDSFPSIGSLRLPSCLASIWCVLFALSLFGVFCSYLCDYLCLSYVSGVDVMCVSAPLQCRINRDCVRAFSFPLKLSCVLRTFFTHFAHKKLR